MAKTLKTIDDLLMDDKNANKHTQRGVGMTQASIQQYGYGDSLTVDKNGKIISGNSRAEILADVKMLDAIVVQSDGTRPIIHQRTDLDLDTDKRARLLSIAMNRTHQVSLDWDAGVIGQLLDEGLPLHDMFLPDELSRILDDFEVPDFGAVGIDEQGRLDEKAKCTCPECGHQFTP